LGGNVLQVVFPGPDGGFPIPELLLRMGQGTHVNP